MKVSPTGAWLSPGGHTFDPSMARAIVNVLTLCNVNSVIDIGCGDGSYTYFMSGAGLVCVGYDGNPHTCMVTNGLCFNADFSEPQYLGMHDAALCLEVGEHIPAQYETIFLDNICRHAEKAIILSWAIPGQGGVGHVNEHSNEYVIGRLADCGWKHDAQLSQELRDAASTCYWFDDTVMVFTYGN